MPSVEKHLELSKDRTGKDYRELHEWMDPWSTNRPLGKERHDILNIPGHISFVSERWGSEGVKEFLHHIKDDYEFRLERYENNVVVKGLKKTMQFFWG